MTRERPSNHSRFGPGMLIAAAFIGPGTVVTASKAGAQFGCDLLWTVLFACFGAIVLQLFAARLGITAGAGLGEFLRESVRRSLWFRPTIALVVLALGVGNAAYQTGNLGGAAIGLASIAGGGFQWWIVAIAALAVSILAIGRYRWLQTILIGLVVMLSLSFITTAALSFPGWQRLASGALLPTVSADNLTLVVALIGTTIVPYNLFLHASSAAENWRGVDTPSALQESLWDTVVSISLGGVVTAAILLTASSAFFDRGLALGETKDIANQLTPILGSYSSYAFAIGLFSAGLTSAITAPLATAYALCGIFGWKADVHSGRFRGIAFAIVAVGAVFAIAFGKSPSQTIVVAQVANGLLLPIVAVVVLVAAGRAGDSKASKFALALGWTTVLLITALATWRVVGVWL